MKEPCNPVGTCVNAMQKDLVACKGIDVMIVVTSLFLGLIIEYAFEYGWETDNWQEEALVTSGTIAFSIMMISLLQRFLYYFWCRPSENTDLSRSDQTEDRWSFYFLKALITECLAGAFSFGLGFMAEYFTEQFVHHKDLDEDKATAIGLDSLTPLGVTLAKGLVYPAAFTFFKCGPHLRQTVCCPESEDGEDLKLLNS